MTFAEAISIFQEAVESPQQPSEALSHTYDSPTCGYELWRLENANGLLGVVDTVDNRLLDDAEADELVRRDQLISLIDDLNSDEQDDLIDHLNRVSR